MNGKKGRRINVVVDSLIGQNLDTVCDKHDLTQSEVVRRALWLMFDVYLEPSEQHRQKGNYVITQAVENVMKENGLI